MVNHELTQMEKLAFSKLLQFGESPILNAARRGLGRVVTNVVPPFGYDLPAAIASVVQHPLLATRAVWNDLGPLGRNETGAVEFPFLTRPDPEFRVRDSLTRAAFGLPERALWKNPNGTSFFKNPERGVYALNPDHPDAKSVINGLYQTIDEGPSRAPVNYRNRPPMYSSVSLGTVLPVPAPGNSGRYQISKPWHFQSAYRDSSTNPTTFNPGLISGRTDGLSRMAARIADKIIKPVTVQTPTFNHSPLSALDYDKNRWMSRPNPKIEKLAASMQHPTEPRQFLNPNTAFLAGALGTPAGAAVHGAQAGNGKDEAKRALLLAMLMGGAGAVGGGGAGFLAGGPAGATFGALGGGLVGAGLGSGMGARESAREHDYRTHQMHGHPKTASDRLALAICISHPRTKAAFVKSADAWSVGKNLAGIGMDFIPGVGSAHMGYNAVKDFSKGNYLSGTANAIGAGVSLIPGVGGGLANIGKMGLKGIGWGAKAIGWGAKGLGATKTIGQAMPTLSRLGSKTLPGLMDAGENMATRATTNLVKRIPGVNTLSKTAPAQWAMQHPTATGNVAGTGVLGAFGVGAVPALNRVQGTLNEGREAVQGAAKSNEWMSHPEQYGGHFQSMLGAAGIGGGDMNPLTMGSTGNAMGQPFNPTYAAAQ